MKALQIFSFLLIAIALQVQAHAEDAVFRLDASKPTKVTIEKKALVVRKHLERIPVPKCKQLIFYTTNEPEECYSIQISLTEKPPKDFRPILVLGESTLMDEVEVIGNRVLGYSILIKTKDKSLAQDWNKRIKALFSPGQA